MIKAVLYDWGGANEWLFQLIHLRHPEGGDDLMTWISHAGSYKVLPLIATGWLIIAVLLQASGNRQAQRRLMALHMKRLLFGMFICLIAVASLKMALDFARPGSATGAEIIDRWGAVSDKYSLPSGHASISAFLTATLWPLLRLPARLAAILFVLAVGVSRVWLGAHFPADVAAGYLVGLASAWASRTLKGPGGNQMELPASSEACRNRSS